MKKAWLVFSLLLCVSYSQAQKSFFFKIKYLPDHIYETSVAMNSEMEMNISGDSLAMAHIKSKGIKLPMLIASNTKMNISAETGSSKSAGSFPLIIKYKSIVSRKAINGVETNDGQNPLMGQSIFARYGRDGKLQIDSISGKALNDEIKAALTKGVSNLINQLKFPDHSLKIGDTFTQEEPFSLPMAGVDMAFSIKITYRLATVENNLAYFDMDESMTMDITTQKEQTTMIMKGTGKGEGKLIYDINKNYSTLRSSNLKMDYKLLVGNLTMFGNAKISATYKTEITASAK